MDPETYELGRQIALGTVAVGLFALAGLIAYDIKDDFIEEVRQYRDNYRQKKVLKKGREGEPRIQTNHKWD